MLNTKGAKDHTGLTDSQIDGYRCEGFIVIRSVLQPGEVDILRGECRRLWSTIDLTKENPRLQRRETVDGATIADRIDPVLDLSPLFQQLVADPRLTVPVEQALDANAAVFKVKLISKWPGTAGYSIHQDYPYWSFVGDVPPDHFVTVLVALDLFDSKSGSTEMFPGLHQCRLGAPTDSPNDVDETLVDLRTGVILEMNPGDIALFHSLTPHRSGPNRSERNRESLFITYVRDHEGNLCSLYYAKRPDIWMDPRER